MFDKAKYVEIGKIVAPHGVRGEVRVVELSEFHEQVLKSKNFYVEDIGFMEVKNIRTHKNFFLFTFSDVSDMDKANTMRGKSIFIAKTEIGKLPEGRYYIDDLLGSSVFDLTGECLGKLDEIITTGSNDVYIVKKEGAKDLLVPALKTVIKSIDIENKKIVLDPPVWED